MKILILSESGFGVGLAHRLQDEGNEVIIYITNPTCRESGLGMLKQVNSWRPSVADVDFIICDGFGFGKVQKFLATTGKPVLGSNDLIDIMAVDYSKRSNLLQKSQLDIPETHHFDNVADAKGLIDVFPDYGFYIRVYNGPTIQCDHVDIFKWVLESIPAGYRFTIQVTEPGTKVSVCNWFNGRHWVNPMYLIVKDKSGNTLVRKDADKLFDETLAKMAPFLKKINHRGPVTIDCIVSDTGVKALDINLYLDHCGLAPLIEGVKEDITDVLFETAMGIKTNINITKDYMLESMLAVTEVYDKMPILGMDENNIKHLYLKSIKKVDDIYVLTDGDLNLMSVLAHGRTVNECRDRIQRTIGNLYIYDLVHNKDIGDNAMACFTSLVDGGWIDA